MNFQAVIKFVIVSVRLILQNVGVDDLACHDGKVTAGKKVIFISHSKYKGRKRDYCNVFSVTFETTSKFLFVYVRLILGKVGVDRVTGSRQEIDIRYEFHLKVILNGLGCK